MASNQLQNLDSFVRINRAYMDFHISFDAPSEQQALAQSQSFRKFVQLGAYPGKLNLSQERQALQAGEAGGLLSSILKVEAAENSLLDFVRSLGSWIQRPKASPVAVTIDTPGGSRITIQGEKMGDDGGDTLHRILQALQRKELIAGANTARVFLLLRDAAHRVEHFPENELVLLQNQWNQAEREYLLGLSTPTALDGVRARVNYGLLGMVDRVTG